MPPPWHKKWHVVNYASRLVIRLLGCRTKNTRCCRAHHNKIKGSVRDVSYAYKYVTRQQIRKYKQGWSGTDWLWYWVTTLFRHCLNGGTLFTDTSILNLKGHPPDCSSVYLEYISFNYNDVLMSLIASQITSLTIVYSTVYSDTDQRNIKAPCHWPLCGEFTGDRWIPRTKGQ